MGILDDAIKEHLELKRKHGVPEEELQRQEEEALGPARREVAQQHEDSEPAAAHTATAEAGDPDSAAVDQETELFDMEADADPDAESAVHETPPAASRPIEIEEPGDDLAAESERNAALGDTEPHGFEAVEDEEEAGEEPEFEDERRPEFDDEGEPDDDEDEADDDDLLSAEEETAAEEGDPDVLEDTPDFLQETPEHDRLWFEQKPPRDFDFD